MRPDKGCIIKLRGGGVPNIGVIFKIINQYVNHNLKFAYMKSRITIYEHLPIILARQMYFYCSSLSVKLSRFWRGCANVPSLYLTTIQTRKVPIVLVKPINAKIITVVWPIIAFSLQLLIMISWFGSSKLLNLFSRVYLKKDFQGEPWWNRISGRRHEAWGGGGTRACDTSFWRLKQKGVLNIFLWWKASKMCALVLNTEEWPP